MIKSNRLMDTPFALFCNLCGKYIDPADSFIRCRRTANAYCSRRCFYYDFLQKEKKTNPSFAQLDNLLEKHCSKIEQKMNLWEAINEITSFILLVYGVYWFLPEMYSSNKWKIYQMFKKFNVTPIDLDRLTRDLYSIKYTGICG
ncbi:MAG: hypothetical protein ACUVXA_12685 [Candidatus Jordarchaeum sp.]|uniref:hypothetical protein n=1 Tax=Candidatus Jordarchaeum sp. TaxID=2823881 RepID=UPI00404B56A9